MLQILFYFLSDYSNARLPVCGIYSLFNPQINVTLMRNCLLACLGPAWRTHPRSRPAGSVPVQGWCLSACANDKQPQSPWGKEHVEQSRGDKSCSSQHSVEPQWRVVCHPLLCSLALLQYSESLSRSGSSAMVFLENFLHSVLWMVFGILKYGIAFVFSLFRTK